MFDLLKRTIKRLLVLVPGIIVTFIVVTDIYPVVDRRLPEALAILLTYVLTAYVLIPAAIRIVRILIKPKHIPLYCTTPDGFASDPVNIGLVGTRKEILTAMKQAGWFLADKRTIKTVLRMGISIVTKRPYPNAPFSNLYLFGRKQDLGFQLPMDSDPSHRHHVRFWAVYQDTAKPHEHLHFWQRHHKQTHPKRLLWVGAASLDIGIRPILHNAQLTHMIHPDTNAERNLLVKHLKETGLVSVVRTIKAGKPYRLQNRAIGGYLIADGELKLCELVAI